MKKGIFDKRIPTVFALAALLIVIIITTVLVQSGVIYIGRAAPDPTPLHLEITNISQSSFTVTFTTNGQFDAVIAMQEGGGTIIYDDRDKSTGKQNKYFSHHITVPNLKPSTAYRFKIISGGKEFDDTNYTASTGPAISIDPPNQKPIFGKIVFPDASAAGDTLIHAKTSTSQIISAVTSANGEFILPTNSLKSANFSTYITLTDQAEFSLNAVRQNTRATIIAPFLVAQNLPPITLSEAYKFSDATDIQEAPPSSALDFTESGMPKKIVGIIAPYEGESFIDMRPLFEGTALPNTNVQIQVSNIETRQVISKSDGTWSHRPATSLAQGKHKLTITTLNETGTPVTISRNFNIFPLGSQVTQSATPSATPTTRPSTPTPTTRATLTPTPTARATATPTTTSPTPTTIISIAPTLTSTPIPTQTPTSQPSNTPVPATPTQLPPIDPPGATENALALTGLSLVLIIAGTVMLFIL